MKPRYRALLRFSTVIALLVLAAALLWNKRAERPRPYGCCTKEQILASSASLCRAVALHGTRLWLSAERDTRVERDGTIRRCWTSDCTDDSGGLVATFLWDAESGDLRLATGFPLKSSDGRATPLSRHEAVTRAQDCLDIFGIRRQAVRWRLSRVQETKPQTWKVDWQAEGRIASVRLNGRSGAPISVECWPLTGANGMHASSSE
jgi:hypothetical protein